MPSPTQDQMIQALSESGYLFEHDVAVLLANLDFHVDTNWAYLDVDSEKSREVDVRAVRRVLHNEEHRLSMYVELLVECKDSGSPFVFLETRKNDRELNLPNTQNYSFPHDYYMERVDGNTVRQVPAFPYLKLKGSHYYFGAEKKATQFAKIVPKSKGNKSWVANHDGVYDQLILPQVKLLEQRKSKVRKANQGNWNYVSLFFPIVTLRDSLFVYDLSGPERVLDQRGRVSFVRHLDSEILDGFYLIDFVTYEYMTAYVTEEIEMFVRAVCQLAESNPQRLIDHVECG